LRGSLGVRVLVCSRNRHLTTPQAPIVVACYWLRTLDLLTEEAQKRQQCKYILSPWLKIAAFGGLQSAIHAPADPQLRNRALRVGRRVDRMFSGQHSLITLLADPQLRNRVLWMRGAQTECRLDSTQISSHLLTHSSRNWHCGWARV
jgi:hypothetical protein